MAHDLHRLLHHLADQRLAEAVDQTVDDAGRRAILALVQGDYLAGQQQAPGGGVDQQGVGALQVAFPVGDTELVADQGISGLGIGDAHQRLGQTHQQDAFAGVQAIFQQQGVDHVDGVIIGPHLFNQTGGAGFGLADLLTGRFGQCHQFSEPSVFVNGIQRRDLLPKPLQRLLYPLGLQYINCFEHGAPPVCVRLDHRLRIYPL